MKFRNAVVYSILLMALSTFSMGCMPYHRGAVLTIGFHDERWHYDHDHDDSWRANHPWREKHREHHDHDDRD